MSLVTLVTFCSEHTLFSLKFIVVVILDPFEKEYLALSVTFRVHPQDSETMLTGELWYFFCCFFMDFFSSSKILSFLDFKKI